MLLSTVRPLASNQSSTIFFTTGLHEPQVEPARVHLVTHEALSQPPSATASTICFFVTSLHEHTCASSGSPTSTPARSSGRLSAPRVGRRGHPPAAPRPRRP